MSAASLMVLASLLFATMGVCVKYAAEIYGTGELVMYRGLIGAVMVFVIARARRTSLRTGLVWMHVWRSIVGVTALALWFHAIGGLPLATAITLNYMSSVWMAVFLIGGSVALGAARVDSRLVATIMVGFAGVALVLKPTLAHDQTGAGITGLVSGMVAAVAYLQVATLARAGEPELRTVFYFSVGSLLAGMVMASVEGTHTHSWRGAGLLLAIGVLATTAQIMMTRAYTIGRPLANASLQFLGIGFSAIYGVWLFQEALSWSAVLGMALIVGAGVAATLIRVRTTQREDVQIGGEP